MSIEHLLDDEDEAVCPKCKDDRLTITELIGGWGVYCQARWHDRHQGNDIPLLMKDHEQRISVRLGQVLARFERWAVEQDQTVLLGSCAYVDKRWTVTISHGVNPDVHTHRGRGRDLSTAYLMLLKDLEVIS